MLEDVKSSCFDLMQPFFGYFKLLRLAQFNGSRTDVPSLLSQMRFLSSEKRNAAGRSCSSGGKLKSTIRKLEGISQSHLHGAGSSRGLNRREVGEVLCRLQ